MQVGGHFYLITETTYRSNLFQSDMCLSNVKKSSEMIVTASCQASIHTFRP